MEERGNKNGIDSSKILKNQKNIHAKAYSYINQALLLDEKAHANGGYTFDNVTEMLKQYKLGIEELKNGVTLTIDPQKATREEKEKFQKLRNRMMANLDNTQSRIPELEHQLSSLSKKTPARPTLGPPSATAARSSRKQPGNNGKATSNSDSKASRKPPARTPSSPSLRQNSSKKTVLNRSASTDSTGSSKTRRKITAADLKGVDPKLAHAVLDEIVDEGKSVTFKDVVGNETAKDALKTAAILPALRPDLYTGLRAAPKGILFFGPPGNGKTLLAKAVACEVNCVFFNISASSLMSKWVGEAEKLVRTLFQMARKVQPTVIFIDEVDSLLSRRKENENDVSRRVKTQFLVELDGVTSKSGEDRVLVLAATNRPDELDDAVIRRFSKRIYIGMPDVNTRKHLLNGLLAQHDRVQISEKELNDLAHKTENYSASDLTNLAAEAALEPIASLPMDQLTSVATTEVRPLTYDDFITCMNRIRPSVPADSLNHFNEWNSKYGDVTSS